MGYVGSRYLQTPNVIEIESDPTAIKRELPVLETIEAPKTQTEVPSTDKVNLNTATADDLQTIPAIGPALAEKIIDYRTKHGKFNEIEELRNIPGVGKKTFQKLSPYLSL